MLISTLGCYRHLSLSLQGHAPRYTLAPNMGPHPQKATPYAGAVIAWIWERNVDGSARFVLATPGRNPLVCLGINPSTATPHKLDPTVKRVSKFAEGGHFDGWAMLNAYPQISTDPKGLHQEIDLQLKEENE